MVTILRPFGPRKDQHAIDIMPGRGVSEKKSSVPGKPPGRPSTAAPTGVELSEDGRGGESSGTGSAPGEGPNPTA